MPTVVDVPGVGEVEFPDSMNMDQINAALKSQFGQEPPSPPEMTDEQKLQTIAKGINLGVGATKSIMETLDNPAAAMSSMSGMDQSRREKAKEAYGKLKEEFQKEGETQQKVIKALNIAESSIEPLTPAGMFNQPNRIMGYDDIAKPNQPMLHIPGKDTLEEALKAKGVDTSEGGKGVAAGAGRLATGVIEGFTTPEMFLTWPLAAQSKVIQAIFGYEMVKNLPEEIQYAGAVMRDPKSTTADKVEALGHPLVSAYFTRHILNTPDLLPYAPSFEIAEAIRKSNFEPKPDRRTALVQQVESGAQPPKQFTTVEDLVDQSRKSDLTPLTTAVVQQQANQEKGAENAVQEQSAEQKVLRDQGIRREGELSGVGKKDEVSGSAQQKAEALAEDNRPAVKVFTDEGTEYKAANRKDDGTWETHEEIINREKIPAGDIDRRVFLDKDGKEKSREEAAAETGIKTEREEGRLHSTDVNREIAKSRVQMGEDVTSSESHIIDSGKKSGTQTYFEEEPPPERKTGRIAYADHNNNRVVVNRYELRDWLETIPVDRRPAALDALFNEELIHLRTPREVARAYWDGLSWGERKLVQRRYTGNWSGRRIGPNGEVIGRFTPEQMGWEAINGRIQRMLRMTPREVLEATGSERWKVKQLLMLENLIGSMREKFPWNSAQKKMLDQVLSNIQLAKRFAGGDFTMPPAQQRQESDLPPDRYEENVPWAFNKKPDYDEKGTKMLLDSYKALFDDLKRHIEVVDSADVADVMSTLAAIGSKPNNAYYRQLFSFLDPASIKKLEDYWDAYPQDKLEMAKYRIQTAQANLEAIKERIDDPSYQRLSGPELSDMERETERLLMESVMGMEKLLQDSRQAFPESYRKVTNREEVLNAPEFEYYAERLKDPTLLDGAILIDADSWDTMLAVPVGGSRVSGSIGCAELLSKQAAFEVAEKLHGKEGFPNVRVKETDGYDTSGMDKETADYLADKKWTVEWGQPLRWVKKEERGHDIEWDIHKQLGEKFGYYPDDLQAIGGERTKDGPYEYFSDHTREDVRQMNLPFAYNKKRKAAEEATETLGLMWGKKTPEGFVEEKETRATGKELGLPSYQERTEAIVNKVREIINAPITGELRAGKVGEKATHEEKFESIRQKVNRPKFNDLLKWLKSRDERITHEKARDLWIAAVWDHLVNAPAQRLVDFAAALRLGEFKNVPEPTTETGATAKAEEPSKTQVTELGLEIPKAAPAPPKAKTVKEKADELREKANQLEKKAFLWASEPKRAQYTMESELGIEAPKLKEKRVPKEEKMTAEELMRSAEGLRLRADLLEAGQDLDLEREASRGKLKPKDIRIILMGEIGSRLINEASPSKESVTRTEVKTEDIGWSNPNAKVSPYRGIRKKEAYTPDGKLNLEMLEKLLLDEARTVESDPVSYTKRLVVLEDSQTGNVVVSAVFKEKGVIRVVEPTGATGTTRGIYVPLESIGHRWRPIWSILLDEPVQGFRKAFSNRQEYLDQFGSEASRLKESNENPFDGSAPEEIKEQAAADEASLVKEDLDDAVTMMTGGMIRDFSDLPEGRLAEFSDYMQEHGIQWGEAAVTGSGPGSKIVRAEMGFGPGVIQKANYPITAREAMSIMHFATDELGLGEIKSKAEMSKLLTELQYLAEAGELKPKHWLAISALRKAAREEYRRMRNEYRQHVRDEAEAAKKEKREPDVLTAPTQEDAYRSAFNKFYDIIQSSESQAEYIARSMGEFTRPVRGTGEGIFSKGDWKKAERERTDLMERRARQLREQQNLDAWLKARQALSEYSGKKYRKTLPALTTRDIPQPEAIERTLMRPDLIPNTTPYWKAWTDSVRKGLAMSKDSYESWLARRSPIIPPPMPRGPLRHNASGDPQAVKLTTPELEFVEQQSAETHPYEPTPQKPLSSELEKRNIFISEYDSGKRPAVVATLTDLERWYSKASRNEKGNAFDSAASDELMGDKDLSSPEAFNRKKAEVDSSYANANRKWKESILGFKLTASRFWDSMKDLGSVGWNTAVHAKSRRAIIEEIYTLRDAMQNRSDRQAWEAGRRIFVQSFDKLEPVLEGAKITRAEKKAHRNRARAIRRGAVAIISAEVKIKDENGKVKMVEVPVGDPTLGMTEMQPITKISRTALNKFIKMTIIAQDQAEIMMRSKNIRDRSIGKRWMKAAKEMEQDVRFALDEYEKTLGQHGPDGKPLWDSHPLKLTADKFKSTMHESLNRQIENGIMITERENYIPGRYDADVFNNGLFYFGPSGLIGLERKKPKVFSSPFHAIASRHGPYIPRSMDVADLAINSLKSANRLIERSMWAEPLKGVKDTATGRNVVKDPKYIVRRRSVMDPTTGAPVEVKDFIPTAPEKGYEIVRLGDSPTSPAIAVLDVYAGAIRSAVSPGIDRSTPILGEAMVLSSILKHGILLTWDTFHPFRLAQYGGAAVSGFNPFSKSFYGLEGKSRNPFNKEFWDSMIDYRGGYTALNFHPADLKKAVEAGLISKSAADWAQGHVTVRSLVRGPTEEGFRKVMKEQVMTRQELAQWMNDSVGLNAFRLTDALYRNAIQNIPFIGGKWNDMLEPANRFIFDKVTTGLMVETAVRNFERLNAKNQSKSSYEIARKVVKDINVIFGNMGRQGIFKNAKWRDFASIFILAPMWREGLIQKDLRFGARGVKAIGKSFAKGILGAYKDTPWSEVTDMGVLGRTYVKGMLTYFVLAQVANLISRNHFTWDNEEKGHALDAWIPVGGGHGYWISTLGVFGEVTHQFLKVASKQQTYVEALLQMGANSLGPVGRMFMAIGTGKNQYGEKATTSAGWIRNVAAELAVIPITLTSPLKQLGHKIAPSLVPPLRPGEGWQRAVGLVGVKAELEQRYQTQVQGIVKEFFRENDIPEPPFDMVMTDQPAANKIRRAIYVGDVPRIKRVFKGYVSAYMKRHPGSSQADAVDTLNKTMDAHANAPWTKSRELDELFISTLKPKDLNLVLKAEIERQKEYNLYQQILPELIRELR